MEYFDVVDINKNKTNKVLSRGATLHEGEYNVGVEVWIINSNNELLITQRSPLKSHPLQWEVPGGCLIASVHLVCLSEFLKLNSENQIVPSVFERYNLIKKFLFEST